jgi:hypothetical protein
MNRGCVCPTCLYGGGVVDWIKKNKLPILGALGTIGALGTSALGYKLGQQVIRDTNRALPSLPYGLTESNYDYLHGSGYGTDFIDWVKKNKKPILATLGTVGATALGYKLGKKYEYSRGFKPSADGYMDL